MRNRTEYANIILGFLQNIDDASDAKEFTRIAIDALEKADESSNVNGCVDFHRESLINEIASVDDRVIDNQ